MYICSRWSSCIYIYTFLQYATSSVDRSTVKIIPMSRLWQTSRHSGKTNWLKGLTSFRTVNWMIAWRVIFLSFRGTIQCVCCCCCCCYFFFRSASEALNHFFLRLLFLSPHSRSYILVLYISTSKNTAFFWISIIRIYTLSSFRRVQYMYSVYNTVEPLSCRNGASSHTQHETTLALTWYMFILESGARRWIDLFIRVSPPRATYARIFNASFFPFIYSQPWREYKCAFCQGNQPS